MKRCRRTKMHPLLVAENLTKSFASQRVLDGVSLSIESGEIVSLIGENGAGKSTVGKILAGIVQPDSGTVWVNGEERRFSHPRDALDAGIVMVHQELCLADNLTVTENTLLGREITRYGAIQHGQMRSRTQDALNRVGATFSPDRRVATLSLAQQQLVEIARAVMLNAKLIIFDEPTSSLGEHESRNLLDLLLRLKREGIAVLYVSHRLTEIQEISDRVIALRDGENSGGAARCSAQPDPFSRDRLITMMIGRELDEMYPYRARSLGDTSLHLTAFQASARHIPVDLTLRCGEIVAIAGLMGSGRSSFLKSIAGVHPPHNGSMTVRNAPVPLGSIRGSNRSRITLVPEDRKAQGAILRSSIVENIALTPTHTSWWGGRRFSHEQREAQRWVNTLSIRCTGVQQPVGTLSGGNQQKVVLARCLAQNPAILLLDEPTRGVDVGARREIYQTLFTLADSGVTVLFVSSDLEEILGIADRALVMSDGAIVADVPREEFSEHGLMSHASHDTRRAA